MTKASRPMTTRPCSEFGSHGPLAIGLARKPSPSRRKKGWFVIARVMASYDGGICAPESSFAKRVSPFRQHILIRLDVARSGERRERASIEQLRQRPHRRAPHQWVRVAQQPPRLVCQRSIVRIADRDQHIADKAIAADALDG